MAKSKQAKHSAEPAPDRTPGRISSALRSGWAHMGFLGVITALLFASFVGSDKMLYGSDTIGHLDARVFFREAMVEAKQFPLWFDCRLSGMPTLDATFGDAMYLPSLACYAVMSVHRALGYRMILHVLLAGVFFYLLLVRGFGTSRWVALVGSVFYMLNPQFVSHVYPGHDGKMYVIAWLPFVVWRLKALMERPDLLRASLLAFGVAMALFTSHIQMTYFMLWGLFLFWLFWLVLDWRKSRDRRAIGVRIAWFWGAVFAGIGLAFIQFFPPFMFVRDAWSVRGVERGFEYAASWSMHWPEVLSLWVPEFGNTLEYYWSENAFKLNTEYVGAIVMMLGVLALVAKPKPWRVFWAAVAVLALLFSLGKHTPVFHVAYHLVPGVKKMRASSMMAFWFSFGSVLLAGLFLNDIANGFAGDWGEARLKKWRKGILVAAGGVTLLCLLFSAKGFVEGLMGALTTSINDPRKKRVFDANFSKNFVPWMWVWWMYALTVLGLVWGMLDRKVSAGVFLTVVMAIGLFDTIRIDRTFIKTISPRPYFQSEETLQRLAAEMDREPFRSFILPGTFSYSNAAGVHHLEGVGDFHDNELRWYREFRGGQDNRNYLTGLIGSGPEGQAYLMPAAMRQGNPFLNLANVRYLVTRQRTGLVTIENEGALGRLSFAPSYRVMDEEEIARALTAGVYDIRRSVALLEEPDQKPSITPAPAVDSTGPARSSFHVTWERYTPNDRRARVRTDRDGFLRISEVWYPGWEVRVDGEPVKIYRADLAWMAVYLEKGEHVVEMQPKSLYLRKASFVSTPLIVALLGYWLFVGVVSIVRRRSSRDSKSQPPAST